MYNDIYNVPTSDMCSCDCQ